MITYLDLDLRLAAAKELRQSIQRPVRVVESSGGVATVRRHECVVVRVLDPGGIALGRRTARMLRTRDNGDSRLSAIRGFRLVTFRNARPDETTESY
jgi:hypothetical protein